MLFAPDLHELRRAAERWLADVQELPGFERELARLDPPAAACRITFRELRRVLDRADLSEAATEQEVFLLGDYEARLCDATKRFLSGVRWGPRALHDALRTHAPLQLPPISDAWVNLDEPIEIMIPAGLQLASNVELLAEWLEQHARQLRALLDRPHNLELEKEAARLRRRAGLPPTAAGHPRPTKIQTVLGHAVEAARLELAGQPVPNTVCQGAIRARRPLEIAAYGDDDPPLHLAIDDAVDPVERRRLRARFHSELEAVARAIGPEPSHGHKLGREPAP